MPTRTSAVNILIDSLLPDDLKDPFRVYDKKGLDQLMTEVAKKYPEQYPRLAKQIGDIGRMQAYRRGETFTLEDFKPVIDRSFDYAELEAEEESLRQRISDPDELRSALAELYGRFSDRITKKTNQAALARRNNIALTVLTGARGKEPQLRDLVSTPGFYPDASGGVVPWFIRKSFAEGMRPADYLAGTYAARAAVTESKRATAQGGFLAKTLSRAAATFTVSSPDCGTTNGVDLTLDEPDIRGRVLQRETAGFPAGTVIDRKVMAALKAKKLDRVIVRSPMTCGAENGICSRCYGVKSEGRFPKVGEHIGITAATAFGEPLTQAALCLAAGTEVLMADFSIKKIEEIQAGDWVMGADKNRNTFPTEVTALHDQGLQDCRRYGFAVGSTAQRLYLTATPEHKMLVNKKTNSLHNFRKYQGAYGYVGPGNYQATVLPVGHPGKSVAAVLPVSCSVDGVNEPSALMLGVFLGDGIRMPEAGHYSPLFSCAEDDLKEDLNNLLKPYGLDCMNRKDVLQEALRRYGILHKSAHEKVIPPEVWGWDRESVSALIGGYLASDGSVFRHKAGNVGISFGSVSKELLEGLKLLLARRLGIYGGSVNAGTKAGVNGRGRDAWTFAITRKDQVIKFSQAISLIPGRKGKILADYIADLPNKAPRHPEPFVRAIRKTDESAGRLHCYDITVNHEDHLFVLANGLIVSNSMKHVVSGKGGKKEFSGLNYIQQFVESPEEFKDRSVVAKKEGRVERIEPAPQGGNYVYVAGERHYVPLDRSVEVSIGDELEAGDSITDGLVDVEDILQYKGLGEARKYWVDRLSEMAKASSAAMDRRHFEVLARANVDHIQLDDPVEEGFLPDDVTRYSQFMQKRQINKPPQEYRLKDSVGKWLEQPALHHTVGTKITPKIAKHLEENGFEKVFVSEEEPSFRPQFVRLQQVAATSDDWLASLGGSYLGNQLQQGITRAQDTNIESNIHPVPRLAVGVGYGKDIERTGKF